MKKTFLLISLLIFRFMAFAQDFSYQFSTDLKLIQNGKTLTNPWAGGLNAPQFSTCKLNNDAVEDLIVYDRTAKKISTYLAVGNTQQGYSWKYAPAYESYFPTIEYWMLMVDYDQDGLKDLFTYAPAGLKIYRNTSTDSGISWQLVANPVYSTGFSGKINLSITASDIPAIVDADNDGDIDVLVFDSSGDFVEYHRNFGVETYQDANRLEFKKMGSCWGNFVKQHCLDFTFGIDCGASKPAGESIAKPPLENPSAAKVLHAGNSILLVDLDGDKKKDLLFGHVSCNNLAAMYNEGTLNEAIFKKANYSYPSINPIDFPVFPAVYFEDLDLDGKKDLIAAPNGFDNATQTVNYQQSVWFYKNVGNTALPAFSFQQKDFFQNSMVDIGENASPLFVDFDGDGDQDLLVGNDGIRYDNGYRASIFYYENTGNQQFELKNNDFLNVAATMQVTNLKPFLADMNGDGVDDIGFVANSFLGMQIKYLPNKAGKGKAFSVSISDVVSLPSIPNFSNGDVPLFVDIDKDGIKDVLVGKTTGSLQYHRNKGSNASPNYGLMQEKFGGISTDNGTEGLSPYIADLNEDGKNELILLSRVGYLNIYKNFEDQKTATFVADTSLIWNTSLKKYARTKMAYNSSLAFAKLSSDSLTSMVLGTTTGGLQLLKSTTKKLITGTEEELTDKLLIYPNPTDKIVTIKSPEEVTINLFSSSGKLIFEGIKILPNLETQLDLSKVPTGIYIVEARSKQHTITRQKIVVSR
jgi:hypothetical protein